MGYAKSLEAAGATIKEYKEFGSYQGTWIALLDDGRLVEGSYGSCSGCDAYEGEFGYFNEPREEDGKYFRDYDEEITKEEYDRLVIEAAEKLKKFGQSYLNEIQTIEEALARYQEKIDDEYAWDDDKEIHEWLMSKLKEGKDKVLNDGSPESKGQG